MMVNPKDFFSVEQKLKVENAIKTAELNTSGEIRVHLDKICKADVLDCAANIFEKLKMHKTELRNGVLFYLSINNRKFAILGDVGINLKVAEDFWDNIKIEISKHFSEGEFAKGLEKGILMAGEQLKKHFPHQADDVNELNDEISLG
jgi:uncharacterized membrane protein